MRLDRIDRTILQFLYQHPRWFNTNQIAEHTRMSWITAHDHLQELFRKGYVVKGKKGELSYWKENQ